MLLHKRFVGPAPIAISKAAVKDVVSGRGWLRWHWGPALFVVGEVRGHDAVAALDPVPDQSL